jgi:hypothetical protein
LWLVHVHKIDILHCVASHIEKASRPNWDLKSISTAAGFQNYLSAPEQIVGWFTDYDQSKLIIIPDSIKHKL